MTKPGSQKATAEFKPYQQLRFTTRSECWLSQPGGNFGKRATLNGLRESKNLQSYCGSGCLVRNFIAVDSAQDHPLVACNSAPATIIDEITAALIRC